MVNKAGKFAFFVIVIMVAIVGVKWVSNKFNIPFLTTISSQV
jgi:hypothetical protein